MFCGKCGTQVPEGANVCPNCGNVMAPKSQAPSMNQAVQNAGQNSNVAKAKVFKNLDNKKIGIIAGGVVALIVVICILVAVFGGSKLKGTYTDGSTVLTFKGNKITYSTFGMEMTVSYKIKKNKITLDPKTLKFSDSTYEYLEDLGMDEDKIDDLIDRATEDIEDDATSKYKYDKKNKILTIDNEDYYYAENYKAGPSGKYTNEDDDDITFTFNNGKATYNNDGDKETFTYYCYEEEDGDVYVMFYGEDFQESEFYSEHYTDEFSYNTKKDKFSVAGEDYEK